MNKYIYELTLKVRDYECDLQGIVNNANYQHYLEHTRHEFLLSAGVSFADLHTQGIDPVVARITISFKTPLTQILIFTNLAKEIKTSNGLMHKKMHPYFTAFLLKNRAFFHH